MYYIIKYIKSNIIACLTLFFSLAFATPAVADIDVTQTPIAQRLVTIAKEYWHQGRAISVVNGAPEKSGPLAAVGVVMMLSPTASATQYRTFGVPYGHHRRARHATATKPRTPIDIRALLTAERKAYSLWHSTPCGGTYHIERIVPPNGPEGESFWESPTGTDRYNSPTSTWTNCTIRLNPKLLTASYIKQSWPTLCTIILHEWGHLTGHPHSINDLTGLPIPGEEPEPPGMTQEQIRVMWWGILSDDTERCGSELRF